jgi:hypothetical protein
LDPVKDVSLDGIQIDSLEIVGQAAGVDQVVIGADGKLHAGQGDVVLDNNGISLFNNNAMSGAGKIEFFDNDAYKIGELIGWGETDAPLTIHGINLAAMDNKMADSGDVSSVINLYAESNNNSIVSIQAALPTIYSYNTVPTILLTNTPADNRRDIQLTGAEVIIGNSATTDGLTVHGPIRGTITFNNQLGEYRKNFASSDTAGIWYKLADVVVGDGTYRGASFAVDIDYTPGRWGQALTDFLRYEVSITRSGIVQDDQDRAVIHGPDSTHFRVVKTAVGTYEMQVCLTNAYSRLSVRVQTLTNSYTTITYPASQTNGSTTGTIYTATTAISTQFVPLITPLTSTSWNGNDTKTDANRGVIDLSSVFGVPAWVKAVLVRFQGSCSVVGKYAILKPGDGEVGSNPFALLSQVANVQTGGMGIIPCDANGDIYFYNETGTTWNNMIIEIYGYWL